MANSLPGRLRTAESNIWTRHACELAAWTLTNLVNRTDVWGGYWNEDNRERLGKTTTRPAKKNRGKQSLTLAVLERHFAARCPEDVVGLHTTSPENTSLWGATELDYHGAGGNSAAANEGAAIGWYTKGTGLGFRPLLTDSNGQGGFHLRFLFTKPVATDRVYAFLRWFTNDHRKYNLAAVPELFPKQPAIKPGGFGNWLRLPGHHHTRDHWSRIWDGRRWLEGDDAVAFLLTLDGNQPDLIPAELPAPLPRTRSAAWTRPQVGTRLAGPATGVLECRLAAYLARLPNLGQGQGRDDVAFQFACWLVRDLQLSDEVALGWLQRWDTGNQPPKGGTRLKEILAGAHAYGRNAYGCGLQIFRLRTRDRSMRFRVEV